jgi:acetyl esterase
LIRSPEDAKNPYAAPLHASDLSGLPPQWSSPRRSTHCATRGGRTPSGWSAPGVKVNVKAYDGIAHGVFWMAGVLERTVAA